MNRSISILHTESSLGWGGQERRILLEAMAMRERGHHLTLACDPHSELYRRARAEKFPITPLRFGGRHNLAALHRLRRLLATGKVDLLNTHSSGDSWLGTLAWRTLKVPRPLLVRTRHLSTPVTANWPTRWLYSAPAAVITTGASTVELLASYLGLDPDCLITIPTGVSLTDFSPAGKDPDRLARLNLPPEAFIFGSVSVLRSWKGHLYLLAALRRLLDRGEEAYLLIVGDGPYRGVIEDKIDELRLRPWVLLTGYQEQVRDWFALMDVVVQASYGHEGVPQALLQACAMEKPVIGTEVGGIPEAVQPELTGLLVPPRDPEQLAAAMRRLMHDAAGRQAMGTRGRQLVTARFSLDKMVQDLETLYEKLSGGGMTAL